MRSKWLYKENIEYIYLGEQVWAEKAKVKEMGSWPRMLAWWLPRSIRWAAALCQLICVELEVASRDTAAISRCVAVNNSWSTQLLNVQSLIRKHTKAPAERNKFKTQVSHVNRGNYRTQAMDLEDPGSVRLTDCIGLSLQQPRAILFVVCRQ